MEESEDRHKTRHFELETELEEKTRDFEETVRELQTRSEE
jgi:hypothetical protein